MSSCRLPTRPVWGYRSDADHHNFGRIDPEVAKTLEEQYQFIQHLPPDQQSGSKRRCMLCTSLEIPSCVGMYKWQRLPLFFGCINPEVAKEQYIDPSQQLLPDQWIQNEEQDCVGPLIAS
jgi:hypothetical protein